MEFVHKGQLIEWDEDNFYFYRLPNDPDYEGNPLDYPKKFELYTEKNLRYIFRSLVLGIHYCILILISTY